MKKILFILSILICAVSSFAQSVYPVAGGPRDTAKVSGSLYVDKRIKAPYFKAPSGDTMVICADAAGNFFAIPIGQVRTGEPGGGGGTTYFPGYAIKIEGDSIKLDTTVAKTYFVRIQDSTFKFVTPFQLATGNYNKTEVNALLAGKSDVGHTHSKSDVVGLQAALDSNLKVESDPYLFLERSRFVKNDDSLGKDSSEIRFYSNSGEVGIYTGRMTKGSLWKQKGSYAYHILQGFDAGFELRPDTAKVSVNGLVTGKLIFDKTYRPAGSLVTAPGAAIYGVAMTDTFYRDSYLWFLTGSGTSLAVAGHVSKLGARFIGMSAGNEDYNSPTTASEAIFKVAGTSTLPKVLVKEQSGQTANNLEIRNSNGDMVLKVMPGGHLKAKTLLRAAPKHISSDYTVNDSDSYLLVDASCVITLPSTYASNWIKIQKASTSPFSYTVQSTYNINGDGPLSISDDRVVTLVFDGSAYWADYTVAPHDFDHIHTSDYQVKADGVELPLHAKSGTDTITCTGCTFPSTVVGMGMFIDSVKSNLSFSTRHMALTAKVTTRVNDTTVRIDKTANFTKRNTPGKYGTINWPYVLQANAAAYTLGINKVDINGQGIICLFPQLSDSASVTAIPLRKSVSWVSEPGTSLFLGVEDQNFVDQDSMYAFGLFEIQASGDYVLRGIKAWGRNYSDQNVGGPTFVRTKQGVNINGSLGIYDCSAYGDTSVHSYTKDLYWGFGINLSARHDSGSKFILDARNNSFYCNTESFQAFDDYLGKECYFDGLYTQYGGSPKTVRYWDSASISSGSHILTVNVDSFSFYHQNSQYDTFNRKYPFSINYGAGTFTSQVDSIIDPHTAYVHDAAPANIVNKVPVFYGPEGEDKYSNQAVYTSWKNVLSKAPHKYNFHKYGTGSAPDAKGSYYYNVVTDTTGMLFGNTAFQGDLLSRHDDTIIVDNCTLYYTPYNQPVNIWADNSRFYGDFINYGLHSRFKGCEFDRFFQYAEDTTIIDHSRALSVSTAGSCYLKVNNSIIKYFPSPARTEAANVTDSNGHVSNTNLRTGDATGRPLVNNSNGEMMEAPEGTFTTPSVLRDSLVNKVDSVTYNAGTGVLKYWKAGVATTIGTVTGGGSGEANTASNLGGGLANFDNKTGVDLQFNSFSSSDFDLASHVLNIDATLKAGWDAKLDWSDTSGAPGLATKYDVSLKLDISTAASTYQPLDADLTALAGLTPTNDDVLQRKAGGWVNRSIAQLKSDFNLTKSDVGLSNVDNTPDASKPVSTAQQTAIDAKVADAINDGTTTIAPSQNAVFDALALKQNSLGFTAENTANKATDFSVINNTKFPTTQACSTYVVGLGYITGNQSITLSGDVSGTGTTAITTTIGAGKVTNAMLAGSIDLTAKVTGILPVANGGTGVNTITGIVKGNGTSAMSAASAGSDYVAPGAVTGVGLTMATARLLGRTTASSGAIEEISIGQGITFSAGSLSGTNASTSTKGVASFASANFSVSSGAVSVATGGIGATEIASTAVTPASYTRANFTVDADGRITAASNGVQYFTLAVSDETTAITTGTAKVTFRMPFACTVTAVRASVNTASSSGNPTFDINEAGTSILGANKLSIDANEKTSQTAATATTIADSSIADDAEITIDIDTAGTGAKGAKITIYYTL